MLLKTVIATSKALKNNTIVSLTQYYMHCYAALVTKYYVIVGFHFFSAQLWYHVASAKVCLC